MNAARNQTQYQVRFDWGLEGAAAIVPGAHILIWVDALPTAGAPDPLVVETDAAVIVGTVGNSAALAAWVLERQADLGDRVIISVVAAGADDGRFAVEDLLAAGSVIDAIIAVGLDSTSPEAAAASASFGGLRHAVSHLLSASVTGKELAAAGEQQVLVEARTANAQPGILVMREFSFRA
ncbi:hypothetical protein EYE40_11015 [Glaciihabitans arcticus]|uniref:Probable 2-phosphosulfolactate phosphatase n=1 Tax=Glaciihabitans arcticus TaxID=2668039 RepID=A0A4V2JF33_9MICO|nr:2-phosphosulfolactate phosphatase [Glaciihabitans arcticus]TBN57879.1 hypothetical protein EYE40_11015 [Glaciihabitans arcticus]